MAVNSDNTVETASERGRGDTALNWIMYGLAVVIVPTMGAIGLAVSFLTIENMARILHMPGWPIMYPIGIDVSILGCIVMDWILLNKGRNGWRLRFSAWALTGFTVWINWHGGGSKDTPIDASLLGVSQATAENLQTGLHAVMPILWVMMLESARMVFLKVREDRSGEASREVPLARWALSPLRTALLYRRMRLWGIGSYRLALAYEEARVYGIDLVRTRLGRGWRWSDQCPRLLRIQLPSGRLPDEVREVVSTLVEQGRTGGWERPVRWWVKESLNAIQDDDAAKAETPPEGLSTDPAFAPLEAPSLLNGSVFGGGGGGPLRGGPVTPSGGPSRGGGGTPSGGGSKPPSRGPSGGGNGTPSRGPSGGAPNGGPEAPGKRGQGAGASGRKSVTGMDDKQILDEIIPDLAAQYVSVHGEGEELTPSYITKRVSVGFDRAKRLLARYYGAEDDPQDNAVALAATAAE